MKRHALLSLCVLLLVQAPAFAQDEGGIDTGGYVRTFLVYSDQSGGTAREAIALVRLRLEGKPSEALKWEVAYELAPWYRDLDTGTFGVAASEGTGFQYRIDDIDRALWPSDPKVDDEFLVVQNLDRAALYYSTSFMDMTLGRQAVAFGSARAVNPTDILAPYAYAILAKEERIGVDALRVRIPTQKLGELDIGAVAGDEAQKENSAAFVRLRSYIAMTDVTLMAMSFRENELVGIDITRAIGGAGTWVEAAYVYAEAGEDENYFRASAGADYSLTADLYAWLEYHYNGPGERDPDNYHDHLGETAYTAGGVYLLGRNYLAPGFTYQLTPLASLGFQALWNLDDGSALLSPSLEYSLADDVTARFGGFAGVGKSSGDSLNPESEFGEYPDIWYASLNFYY